MTSVSSGSSGTDFVLQLRTLVTQAISEQTDASVPLSAIQSFVTQVRGGEQISALVTWPGGCAQCSSGAHAAAHNARTRPDAGVGGGQR